MERMLFYLIALAAIYFIFTFYYIKVLLKVAQFKSKIIKSVAENISLLTFIISITFGMYIIFIGFEQLEPKISKAGIILCYLLAIIFSLMPSFFYIYFIKIDELIKAGYNFPKIYKNDKKEKS